MARIVSEAKEGWRTLIASRPPDAEATPLGLDLLGQTFVRLRDGDLGTLAAQAPSDVPHLLRFYQQYFRRQGSFPVFERPL